MLRLIRALLPSNECSEHSVSQRPRAHFELQTRCVHASNHCPKTGVSLFAQGFEKLFSGDASAAGQLHHAARQSDATYGFDDQSSVFWCFVPAGL